MANKKLYQSAQEIIEGYGLHAKRGTRKVYLMGKALSSGNVSLMRYSSKGSGGDRVRHREYLGVILNVETGMSVKRENEEKIRLQRVICDTINNDLEREEAEFRPAPKNKIEAVRYIEKLADRALQETGNRHSMYAALGSLAKHVDIFSPKCMMADLGKEWCLGFIDYLKSKALNLNFQRTEDTERRKKVALSANSQNRLIRNLNHVLNHASRDGVILSNPMSEISSKEKVKSQSGTRIFLDQEEVSKLASTPYKGNYDIKAAFLFACYTGLRYSDLQKLRHSDFQRDKVGTFISIRMQKTKQPLRVYVPAVALSVLPERTGEDDLVFRLPKNDAANRYLKKWVTDAGVTGKTVTFHCARHSAATLLLSNGIPLAVVSKQLGHMKIGTTEIYAKILDDAQHAAANKMDELFKITCKQ